MIENEKISLNKNEYPNFDDALKTATGGKKLQPHGAGRMQPLVIFNQPGYNSPRRFSVSLCKRTRQTMKKLMFALITLISLTAMHAQQPKAAAPEKSDPQAKKVLDKIRKKYEGYKTLEVAFSLSIEVPGQDKEVQKGTISQEDKKFRLEMEQQVIVSDGTTTWVYLKKSNEVQINDADPKDTENGFLTPKDLLKRYQKGDYLYSITDKITENSKVFTQIEFKPVDKNSEYSKIRVSIDEKAGSIQSVKAFGKDASRYTFSISKLTPNKQFEADHFTFDTKKYPGAKVEDLRL